MHKLVHKMFTSSVQGCKDNLLAEWMFFCLYCTNAQKFASLLHKKLSCEVDVFEGGCVTYGSAARAHALVYTVTAKPGVRAANLTWNAQPPSKTSSL